MSAGLRHSTGVSDYNTHSSKYLILSTAAEGGFIACFPWRLYHIHNNCLNGLFVNFLLVLDFWTVKHLKNKTFGRLNRRNLQFSILATNYSYTRYSTFSTCVNVFQNLQRCVDNLQLYSCKSHLK